MAEISSTVEESALCVDEANEQVSTSAWSSIDDNPFCARSYNVDISATRNKCPVFRIKLDNLRSHFTCVLCEGFLIDAYAVVVCQHTFCFSCIVKHLQTKKFCPTCFSQVTEEYPNDIAPDKTLQRLVFKLVPGLYRDEVMRRRRHSEGDWLWKGEHFYHPEEVISLSLKYRDEIDRSKETFNFGDYESDSFQLNENNSNLQPYTDMEAPNNCSERYLKCAANTSIYTLQRLIKCKNQLSENAVGVDIMYEDEILHPQLTLMDVAYSFSYDGKLPMAFSYHILQKSSVKATETELVPRLDEDLSSSLEFLDEYVGKSYVKLKQLFSPIVECNNNNIVESSSRKRKKGRKDLELPFDDEDGKTSKIYRDREMRFQSAGRSSAYIGMDEREDGREKQRKYDHKESIVDNFKVAIGNDFKFKPHSRIQYSIDDKVFEANMSDSDGFQSADDNDRLVVDTDYSSSAEKTTPIISVDVERERVTKRKKRKHADDDSSHSKHRKKSKKSKHHRKKHHKRRHPEATILHSPEDDIMKLKLRVNRSPSMENRRERRKRRHNREHHRELGVIVEKCSQVDDGETSGHSSLSSSEFSPIQRCKLSGIMLSDSVTSESNSVTSSCDSSNVVSSTSCTSNSVVGETSTLSEESTTRDVTEQIQNNPSLNSLLRPFSSKCASPAREFIREDSPEIVFVKEIRSSSEKECNSLVAVSKPSPLSKISCANNSKIVTSTAATDSAIFSTCKVPIPASSRNIQPTLQRTTFERSTTNKLSVGVTKVSPKMELIPDRISANNNSMKKSVDEKRNNARCSPPKRSPIQTPPSTANFPKKSPVFPLISPSATTTSPSKRSPTIIPPSILLPLSSITVSKITPAEKLKMEEQKRAKAMSENSVPALQIVLVNGENSGDERPSVNPISSSTTKRQNAVNGVLSQVEKKPTRPLPGSIPLSEFNIMKKLSGPAKNIPSVSLTPRISTIDKSGHSVTLTQQTEISKATNSITLTKKSTDGYLTSARPSKKNEPNEFARYDGSSNSSPHSIADLSNLKYKPTEKRTKLSPTASTFREMSELAFGKQREKNKYFPATSNGKGAASTFNSRATTKLVYSSPESLPPVLPPLQFTTVNRNPFLPPGLEEIPDYSTNGMYSAFPPVSSPSSLYLMVPPKYPSPPMQKQSSKMPSSEEIKRALPKPNQNVRTIPNPSILARNHHLGLTDSTYQQRQPRQSFPSNAPTRNNCASPAKNNAILYTSNCSPIRQDVMFYQRRPLQGKL